MRGGPLQTRSIFTRSGRGRPSLSTTVPEMKITCGAALSLGKVEVGWRELVFPFVLPPVVGAGGAGVVEPGFWARAAPVNDNATAAKMAAPRKCISASCYGVIILRDSGRAEAV